jgi:hypothetical protein
MKFNIFLISFFLLKISLSAQMKSPAMDSVSLAIQPSVDSVNASTPPSTAGSIKFPNAFMWNHAGPTGGYSTDKPDDSVFAPAAKNVITYKLQVFSRSGALLFESTDIRKGWDGYLENGAIAPQGVYVWKASGKFIDGTQFRKAGDVTFIY